MWLTAYSMNGRASSTRLAGVLRICLSSSVETSAVFWFGSSKVPWNTLAPGWAGATVGTTRNPSVTSATTLAVQVLRIGASLAWGRCFHAGCALGIGRIRNEPRLCGSGKRPKYHSTTRQYDVWLWTWRLRAFAAFARRRSFSAAAQELRISQPAVSKHVADVERDVGVLLVARRPRGGEL